MDDLAKWRDGTFTVSRDLYLNRDENLCRAIEKCIWVSQPAVTTMGAYSNLTAPFRSDSIVRGL
jgi:hypothetical protein